jgi:hypothetical protein
MTYRPGAVFGARVSVDAVIGRGLGLSAPEAKTIICAAGFCSAFRTGSPITLYRSV